MAEGNGSRGVILSVLAIGASMAGMWINIDQKIEARARVSDEKFSTLSSEIHRHAGEGHVTSREQFARIEAWTEDLRHEIVALDEALQREMRAQDALLTAQLDALDGRLQREMRDLDQILVECAALYAERMGEAKTTLAALEERLRALETRKVP